MHNNPAAAINIGCQRSPSFTTLLPYCGILRTGNLRQEEHRNQDEISTLDWDTGECRSTQKSTASVSSAPSPPFRLPGKALGKRCHEDEDSDILLLPNPLRSHPPQKTSLPHVNALRPILQPKTRKPNRGTMTKGLQESSHAMDIDDFQEVAFLRFEDCMEQENGPS